MAETTLPSVRGRSTVHLFVILLTSATMSGGLVGFALGIGLSPLPTPSSDWLLASIVVALVADTTNQAFGRPKPLTLGKQVPREWGELLEPRVVAALYGARLGLGPSTILSTWMWWSGSLVAALLDVWVSVAFGAVFGATRVVSTGLVSQRAARVGHSEWFGRLRAAKRPAWRACNVAAAALCVAAFTASCSGSVELTDSPTNADSTTLSTGAGIEASSDAEVPTDQQLNQETPSVTATPDPTSQSSVIAAIPTADPNAPITPVLTPDELAGRLVANVSQFNRIQSADADRFLDLEAATQLQPDPTEEGPLLETRGFRGGWTRAFRNDTQDVVITAVYDFTNDTEAAFYREDGLITLGGYGAEFFDIPELPASRGFRTESNDDVGPIVTWGLTFTDGNHWYLLYLVGDPATATVDVLVGAAIQQYQLLGIPIQERAAPTTTG